jgi:hypothetical protein
MRQDLSSLEGTGAVRLGRGHRHPSPLVYRSQVLTIALANPTP